MSSAPSETGNELRQHWIEVLKTELGKDVVQTEIAADELFVRVNSSAWLAAATACRDKLGCDFFSFLSGIDWLPNDEMNGEKVFGALEGEESAEPTPMTSGVAGGSSRFQVFARFFSTTTHTAVIVKADLDEANPSVESIQDVYAGADWHERETWEMYGFNFVGHPRLRHIYLPGEFEGNPLRKDFPLLARELKPWPGLVDMEPIPGEGAEESAES